MSIKSLAAYLPAILLIVFPGQASAHSFGLTYTLPLPLWIFAYGAGAAVIASFLVMSFLFNKERIEQNSHEIDLTAKGFGFLTRNWFINLAKILSVLLFVIPIASGILGNSSSYYNINMPIFWIFFVLGFTYLTAIIGDIYSVINPIKVTIELFEKLFRLKVKAIYNYPAWLSYYPAFIFYILFIYIELFKPIGPYDLSFLLLQYIAVTIGGVIFLGKEIWFKYCDFFSVFFKIIGRVSILHKKDGKIYFRVPFSGLLKDQSENISQVLFIIFMLSSTAFDGFRSTRAFHYLHYWIGFIPYSIFPTLLLVLSPFLFFGIYLLFIWISKLIAGSKESLKKLALYFAYSLVPIALVYNIAHYYTLIITESQSFIGLLSDPLGFGWNLLGTANFPVNLALVDTVMTWYAQVGLILLGHIVGVYLAHVCAIRIFPKTKWTVVSQLPMLLLMVIYTMAGLWILAEPITTGGLL